MSIKLPRYHGAEWIKPQLPTQAQPWLMGKQHSIKKDRYHRANYLKSFGKLLSEEHWEWPQQPIFFITDLHGDTDAFLASLVASGAVKKTGASDHDLELTAEGRRGKFLIGGDCFDKGPSTLRLLRTIKRVIDTGADLTLLAGNHDIRMLLGIRSIHLPPDPRTDHFFIRMGPKTVPFLQEIHDHYLQEKKALKRLPSNQHCRRLLYPPKRWFKEFPKEAVWVMPEAAIEREIERMRLKIEQFSALSEAGGLTPRLSYAAAVQWEQLFLHPEGEFYWFYERMQLSYRSGSFLFIHAGLDDQTATILQRKGWRYLNRKFRKQMYGDPFKLYYGPFANTIRTKYRQDDRPLTRKGVRKLIKRGIRGLVHGHRALEHGQRLMLRKGLLNIECDTTLNRNTRKRRGMKADSAAVTILRPEGYILGISSDYPYIKVFSNG